MDVRKYIMKEGSSYKIYLDMDGVITDFEGAFNNLTGKKPKEVPHFWEYLKDNSNFWTKMSWYPGGKLIWAFVKNLNPFILSAPIQDPSCIIGKGEWIDKNLGRDIPRIFDAQKWKYANSHSILIDDLPKNIKAWEKNGGIGILHKRSVRTLQKLKQILGMI